MDNPRSTASIAGHPIHPMLVPFPLRSLLVRSSPILFSGGPAWRSGPPLRSGF